MTVCRTCHREKHRAFNVPGPVVAGGRTGRREAQGDGATLQHADSTMQSRAVSYDRSSVSLIDEVLACFRQMQDSSDYELGVA